MRGIRRGSWRWSCTPTSWARRTGSNMSETRSPISAGTRTWCSGPANRSSTGIWGSKNSRMRVENATIAELQQALAEGRTSASALTRAYLARIEAYDRAGPGLNAVREVNPDALAIAALLDGVMPSRDRPLAGIPILLKDNIATGDQQHTTAGSLALAEARGY